jgi:hypothetical protein
MAYEEPRATWDKRYKQRHYSYRDFHTATTSGSPATYTFGTNARAISKVNWPAMGDFVGQPGPGALACYGREVEVQCTKDAWVVIVSVNPRYLTMLALGYTATQIAALVPAVPATITEVAMFVPQGSTRTFYPTYGSAIVFYQDSESGTIRIWIEGNVEGTE